MKKIMGLLLLVGLCLALVSPGYVFSASDATAKYMKLIDSPDVKNRIRGAKLMVQAEVTDTDLLDHVKEKLMAGYQTKTRDRHHYDEMAYYCKALGASANSDYMDVLKEVEKNTPNRNLKRHAINSQKLLTENQEMKKMIASREGWDKSLSNQENLYVQMLRSDKFRLKRDAAKQIYDEADLSPKVYKVVAEQLLDGLNENLRDRDTLDGMAWLCKALGSSGLEEHKETLNQINQGTRNKKLKKYATQALGML